MLLNRQFATGRLLGHIDTALGRIDAGGYGDCVTCGKEISVKRLQALPFDIRCMACEGLRRVDDAPEKRSTGDDGGTGLLNPVQARS